MTGICDAVDELCAEGRETSSCSSRASARSSTPRTPCRATSGRASRDPTPRPRRDHAALRPAVGRRAAPRVPGAPGRRVVLLDQRRRDLADGPGHPVRRRPRHSPHLAATPRRPRCSACRSSRSRRPRPTSARVAAAVSPTASRSASTPRTTSSRARVHRARDPAHVPRLGAAADDLGRRGPHARRRRAVPLRRAAGHPRDPRRRPAAHRARCARDVEPGPADERSATARRHPPAAHSTRASGRHALRRSCPWTRAWPA